MKKAGLLGGMSWESTVTYYQIINETVREKLGGSSSADMIIRSLDLEAIEKYQSSGNWDAVADILCHAAAELENAGADFIVMASNTVHRVYPDVAEAVGIPVLHIADAVIDAVHEAGIDPVGLLGTKYTMQGDFLKEKLFEAGISVLVPTEERMQQIHDAIFSEAPLGKVRDETKRMLYDVVAELRRCGARGIVLGCTELGLMIHPEESCLPIFDTVILHAGKAAELILREE